jgi:hypothetical protein
VGDPAGDRFQATRVGQGVGCSGIVAQILQHLFPSFEIIRLVTLRTG